VAGCQQLLLVPSNFATSNSRVEHGGGTDRIFGHLAADPIARRKLIRLFKMDSPA
jgi:hypothetical protein